jgi:ATP-binding protein involved in chromosome partitioning
VKLEQNCKTAEKTCGNQGYQEIVTDNFERNNTMSNESVTVDPALQENLGHLKHRIMVLSGKGGVGKSTVSVNLAYGLALNGKSVGILDADLHGPSIAKMLGIEGIPLPMRESDHRPEPVRVHDTLYALTIASLLPSADDPVVWRGPMKMGALRQFLTEIAWPELDYLIIDCPPGTGDEPLTMLQLLGKVDGIVIVSTPQDVAYLDARKTISFAHQLTTPVIGIIENMSAFPCPHCGEMIDLFPGSGADRAAEDFGIDVLGKIPFDTFIAQSGDKGRPYIYDYSKLPAAGIMSEIALKVISTVEK